jgi:uncharacterized protein YukE
MPTNQIRAHFATIDQLAADQNALAGNVDGIRSQLRQHAQQALQTIDGGMGAEEHQACMHKIDQLIDEYLRSTHDLNRSTTMVGQTFLAGGNRARGILGSGG